MSNIRKATVIRYMSTVLLLIFSFAFYTGYINSVVEAEQNPAPPPSRGSSGVTISYDGELKVGAAVNLDDITAAASWLWGLTPWGGDSNNNSSSSSCTCGCGGSGSSCGC